MGDAKGGITDQIPGAMMDIRDLNGLIEITYTYPPIATQALGTVVPLSLAHGVIVNGRFVAADIGGCTCAGRLMNYDGKTVAYECVWDASRADPNVTLFTLDTLQPTRGQVRYSATLNLTQVGGALLADGKIQMGPAQITVAVRRIAPLN